MANKDLDYVQNARIEDANFFDFKLNFSARNRHAGAVHYTWI